MSLFLIDYRNLTYNRILGRCIIRIILETYIKCLFQWQLAMLQVFSFGLIGSFIFLNLLTINCILSDNDTNYKYKGVHAI